MSHYYIAYLKGLKRELQRKGIPLDIDLNVSRYYLQDQIRVLEDFFYMNNLIQKSGGTAFVSTVYRDTPVSYLREKMFKEFEELRKLEDDTLTKQPEDAGVIIEDIKPIEDFIERIGLQSKEVIQESEDENTLTVGLSGYSVGTSMFSKYNDNLISNDTSSTEVVFDELDDGYSEDEDMDLDSFEDYPEDEDMGLDSFEDEDMGLDSFEDEDVDLDSFEDITDEEDEDMDLDSFEDYPEDEDMGLDSFEDDDSDSPIVTDYGGILDDDEDMDLDSFEDEDMDLDSFEDEDEDMDLDSFEDEDMDLDSFEDEDEDMDLDSFEDEDMDLRGFNSYGDSSLKSTKEQQYIRQDSKEYKTISKSSYTKSKAEIHADKAVSYLNKLYKKKFNNNSGGRFNENK